MQTKELDIEKPVDKPPYDPYTDTRADVTNMQLLTNIEYEVAANVNTYFLLTTQNIVLMQKIQ